MLDIAWANLQRVRCNNMLCTSQYLRAVIHIEKKYQDDHHLDIFLIKFI